MPFDSPRSGATGSHGDADRSRRDRTNSLGRRAFLRRTAGTGAGVLSLSMVGVGGVRAQEGTETGAEEGEEEEETVTTRGVLPADAPKLGNPDFTGLLVHVAGVNQDVSTRDVSGCSFVESDDASSPTTSPSSTATRSTRSQKGAGRPTHSCLRRWTTIRSSTASYSSLRDSSPAAPDTCGCNSRRSAPRTSGPRPPKWG